MLKKLDKLIFKSFFGPFILTTAVAVFIFLVQFILQNIDHFVGKDLGAATILELLGYFTVNMVPVALPLGALLSSLITFGNLGEHFELTAIKSSGISLIRVIAPLFVFIVMLTIAAFFYSNEIVTKANLKAFSLLWDIKKKKPALEFVEGGFYNGIPGYSIKVNQKYKDGNSLKGLMIYDHTSKSGNTDLTIADSGTMKMIKQNRYMEMTLFNGISYKQKISSYRPKAEVELTRVSFYKATILFNLSSFALNNTPEELFKQNRVMLPVRQIRNKVDSMEGIADSLVKKIPRSIKSFYHYMAEDYVNVNFDSIYPDKERKIYFDSLSPGDQDHAAQRMVNTVRNIKEYSYGYKENIRHYKREANRYNIEKYRKYTQSFAILMMFLIGAPLGTIIKKGGLGVPIIVSIIFFILYYIISILGEKYAKESVMEVWFGMWLPNIVLMPLGLFFLRQAKNDARLFDSDFYAVAFNRLKRVFKKK